MVFLEDLLKNDNFAGVVEDLASDFRARHDLGKIHQLGIVVEDVEKAAAQLESKGIGPFFIATGAPVFWRKKVRSVMLRESWESLTIRALNWNCWNPSRDRIFTQGALINRGRWLCSTWDFWSRM